MRENFPINDISKEWMLKDFKKKKISFDEQSMISILEDENSTFHLKQDAGIALREIGTKKSLNALKNCIHLGNKDLQAICILTIAQIGQSDFTEYILSLLNEKRIQIAYVLWALFAIDDKKAISEVEKFVESRMKIDKRPNSKKLSPVHHGIVLIENYGQESELRAKILDFYNSNWEKLNIQQQNILRRNTEYFKNN